MSARSSLDLMREGSYLYTDSQSEGGVSDRCRREDQGLGGEPLGLSAKVGSTVSETSGRLSADSVALI